MDKTSFPLYVRLWAYGEELRNDIEKILWKFRSRERREQLVVNREYNRILRTNSEVQEVLKGEPFAVIAVDPYSGICVVERFTNYSDRKSAEDRACERLRALPNASGAIWLRHHPMLRV